MGGRIGKGVVFGGAYFRDQGLSLSVEDEVTDGDEPQLEDTTFSLDRVGPFLEWYPNPDGGLHFQALLAWGDFNMHRPDGIEVDDPSGLFMSLAAGYEWFVDERWRVGALARLTYAPLDVSETAAGTNTSVDLFSPSLLLNATYH
jgi:hypothetical protein